jgi:hypothetical protein
MDYFTRYVYLVFLVKIIFISLALYGLVLKKGKKQDKGTKAREAQVTYWKERIEFVFVALMSLLLIYIFFPRSNRINLIKFSRNFSKFYISLSRATVKKQLEIYVKAHIFPIVFFCVPQRQRNATQIFSILR